MARYNRKNGNEDGALGYFIWRIVSLLSLAMGILALLYLRNSSAFNQNAEEDPSVEPSTTADPNSQTPDNNIDYVAPDVHGYYYSFLSANEQTAYEAILGACMNYETSITFTSPLTEDEMVNVQKAVVYDHPEYYWINNTYYTSSNGEGMVTAVEYDFHGNEESVLSMIYQIADEVVAAMPRTSEYEAYKYFYDYIIDNTEYDASADVDNQNVTSVFFDKVSVCAGYSKAFKLLCDRAGLDCVFVTGDAATEKSENERHAWNFVRINGQAYWIDVTWGDPIFAGEGDNKNYNYFFVTDDMMNIQHNADAQLTNDGKGNLAVTYPACNDDSYDYYVQQNSYFAVYNRDEVAAYISNQVNSGSTVFEMRFGSEEELKNAMADLFDQSALYSIVNTGENYYNSYSYTVFDKIGVLDITMAG